LKFNDAQLADRVRLIEKMIDTRATPLWKRVVFRLDGWPGWVTVAENPLGVHGVGGGFQMANKCGSTLLRHQFIVETTMQLNGSASWWYPNALTEAVVPLVRKAECQHRSRPDQWLGD
jgi:hypothetical protein